MSITRKKEIVIRLSDDEYANLKRKVAESNLNQREYITAALNDAVILNDAEMQQCTRELHHIGVNINQIAKYCNANRAPASHQELQYMNYKVEKIWVTKLLQ